MPDVFISHITEEAPLADALKIYLKSCFGDTFSVFVWSDYDSIGTGEEWYRAIVDGILGTKILVVLLSKYSVDRPWINFETGVAVGARKRVLPVTIRSFPPALVPFPLAGFHIRVLTDELAMQSLVATIGEIVSLRRAPEEVPGFIERLRRIEDTLPMKGITIEPLLEGRGSSNPILTISTVEHG